MLFAALVVPVLAATSAKAATPDNVCKLDVSLETASNPTGRTHTLTAVVDPDATCTDAVGAEVDFEIESGPAARVNVTGDAGIGGTASDDGNTPLTRDLTCTTPAVTGGGTNVQCTVTFTSDTAGTHVIRAWVDDDKDNSTLDFDATEGQLEGTTPGSRTEPDDTDVVTKSWFGALTNATLNCTPETASNPNTGDGSTETYTCTAYTETDNDDVQEAGENPLPGLLIDGENLAGANDPDNVATAGTADYNDGGTTAADGSATINVAASEAQAGAANICFWIDNNANTTFDPAGTVNVNDGADCDLETQATVDGDETDVVTKTWVAVGVPASLTLTPENDQNVIGTSHTVTATVTDAFGNLVSGVNVDFDITASSRNGGGPVEGLDRLTNASGQATFTYADLGIGTPVTGGFDQDVINAWADIQTENDSDDGTGEPSDSANKFWFAADPAAAEVVYDPGETGPDCEDTDAATDTEAPTNPVGTRHTESCASVFNASNQPIPGEVVTFTSAGPGQFHNDADGDTLVDAGELVDTITVTTDVNGDALVTLYSEESGTQTVTATADAQSDSGTKTWTALGARNIDCSPDTKTNPTGTSHVIECTATDRYGNMTSNAGGGTDEVSFTETGPGRIDSDASPILGADGTVEVIVSTVDGEEGTQSITGELESDVPDSDTATDTDDACDQPANDGDTAGPGPVDPGAPAGNCEVTVEKVWSDTVPPPTVTDHARTAHLNRFKHINFGGGRRSLKVSGTLSTDDGLLACSANQKIKVQIRAGGEWITRKSDTTNANGKFKVLIRDITKKYRAVAPKSSMVDGDGNIDNCLRAVSNVRRHRHRHN